MAHTMALPAACGARLSHRLSGSALPVHSPAGRAGACSLSPNSSRRGRFWEAPSLFYWLPQDPAFTACGWLGLVLALVALSGFSERYGTGVSMGVWAALWGLYLSTFVNVGQVFYAFGWESILLEAGFFAIFLGSTTTLPSSHLPALLRWVLFRVMFGAGLIKLRGDPCWRDYTCLFYHYETQAPNPLSWCFHWLPKRLLSFGVLVNHGVELLVPFVPQPLCAQ